MPTHTRLFVAAALLLVLPIACRSPKADVPCRCGTELAELEGCAHAGCRDGRSNPENPDCVCGTIEIPTAKKH